MPCERFELELPDGTVSRGFICHRGRRQKAKPCVGCAGPSSLLCDAPIGGGKTTCDASICAGCAVHDGPDLDFCPAHVAPRGFIARDRAEWDEFFAERAAIVQFLSHAEPPRDDREKAARRAAAEQAARRLSGPRPTLPMQPPGWFRGEVAAEHRRETGKSAGLPAAAPAPRLGASSCRSCGKAIVFASTTGGKVGPFELDTRGDWEIHGGVASHAGGQLELLATVVLPRYTSHFASCPQADSWRAR